MSRPAHLAACCAGLGWEVGHVVNAAGLHADVVGDWFGFCDDYVVLPFKGLYWYWNWAVGRLRITSTRCRTRRTRSSASI